MGHDDPRQVATLPSEGDERVFQQRRGQVAGLVGPSFVLAAEGHLGQQHVRRDVLPRVGQASAGVAGVEQGDTALGDLEPGRRHRMGHGHCHDPVAQDLELLIEVHDV